ncbi:MAG: flagellar type III secretion system protein FliR [Firmicutes bacterium]|nr:flagellar type III secretion system protein FliR [Bacillota bacterium]
MWEGFAQQAPGLFLVFTRLSGLIVTAPLFSYRNVPILLKMAFASLLAAILFPYAMPPSTAEFLSLSYFLQVLEELALGLALGFVASLSLQAIYLAGQLMDVPMGFGMVNILDPQLGVQVPIMARFYNIVAILVFLGVNGHHMVLMALMRSFELLPIGQVSWGPGVVMALVRGFAWMFVLGVKIALPIMGAIFLTDIALGVIARSVPQMNVFLVGFPVKIGVGLFLLVFVVPTYVRVIAQLFSEGGDMLSHLWEFIGSLKG